jgi:hypothetical protein
LGDLIGIPIEIALALGQKPDGTARPELAIDVRIPAFQTVFAQVDLVLHADKTGLCLRVIDAIRFCHDFFGRFLSVIKTLEVISK